MHMCWHESSSLHDDNTARSSTIPTGMQWLVTQHQQPPMQAGLCAGAHNNAGLPHIQQASQCNGMTCGLSCSVYQVPQGTTESSLPCHEHRQLAPQTYANRATIAQRIEHNDMPLARMHGFVLRHRRAQRASLLARNLALLSYLFGMVTLIIILASYDNY
eukprot:TRINITY_DN719_c0_g1_i8.p1 TRINITY_DN719_c0_g1~~TRINITY_DN719_c0_g1_i8.p1  ORF type:complete len:160 (-),score=10.19 TRINITY_DN719_c0_g1_i8:388-867(-)